MVCIKWKDYLKDAYNYTEKKYLIELGLIIYIINFDSSLQQQVISKRLIYYFFMEILS